ncbi:hypothetical protein GBW32_22715 [Streptomyces tsukubensis]|uniref:Uncharacterized protein n=1 Tax=Streptomyces tsukubensis TaxID=83656 RepID=A0A1V4A428_9ACTN|nr:DUF5691 domain-containing protein [Streptomyces tsukubensis]OON74242.1 hypothetical protein B1H18_25475 [Streptomyces tsukubensis]QFR95324.1 hypothetical protein GBW32_22715 [Streptomyces tsukubensis]
MADEPAWDPAWDSPWEELVTVALLGTDRRPLPRAVPGADGASALLDAAAVRTLRRRAGLVPVKAAALPEPAAPDPRPALPPAARHRLALLLSDQSAAGIGGGRRGSAPDLTELLPQWLAATNSEGYAPPAELLPALLDTARGRTDIRPQALRFAGPRGLWLARLNPDWKFALRDTQGGGGTLPAPDRTEEVEQLWQEGLFAERVALLSLVRNHAPEKARALLGTTWAKDRAEDRLMFLDSLRTGLSEEDEPFLERALSDRSRNVRSTAAELLSALPGSALAGRMAARAVSCVALDRTAGMATEATGPPTAGDTSARDTPARDTPTRAKPARDTPAPTGEDQVVTVEAPHECDAEMERDGVLAQPPQGRGERSWWLGQLVEAAPLAVWPKRFRGLSPEGIVALPVADGWRDELHAAWCRAAVRQRDPVWSRALLGSPAAAEAGGPGAVSLAERARLLVTLPAPERAEWVAGFISAHGLSEAFQLLGACGTPWDESLGGAVVDALNIARDAGSYPWSFSGVMGLAERCLHPGAADRLESLIAIPDETSDSAPGAGSYWSEAFQRLVSTLRLRETMFEELTPPAPR